MVVSGCSDFSDTKHHNASSDWSRFEIETAFLEVGTKFNLKVEPTAMHLRILTISQLNIYLLRY